METTDIVSLYQVPILIETCCWSCFRLLRWAYYAIYQQNSSEELYSLFEYFYDHFHTNPQNSSHGNFISSHSNNVHALDQLRTIKNKANSTSQVILIASGVWFLFFDSLQFLALLFCFYCFHKVWGCLKVIVLIPTSFAMFWLKTARVSIIKSILLSSTCLDIMYSNTKSPTLNWIM